MGLFFDQLDGLEHGYSKKTEKFPEFKIPTEDFLWMNIDGDREDLEQVFPIKSHESLNSDQFCKII